VIKIKKLDSLKKYIKSYDRVMVAFSGGADSTFLLKVCADELGRENVVAATGTSVTYTLDELRLARETAETLGVRHIVVDTDEMGNDSFSANTGLRCYYCKNHLYSKLTDIARSEGIDAIFDGNNLDDAGDYRPGLKAVAEWGILSPLIAAGLTKDEIRRHSREMGLVTWDRPANPCLASRIPYGSRITREKLEAVAEGEKFIRDLGFKIVRVRHHGAIARIEIPLQDMPRFFREDVRERVNARLKDLGFIWVAVDLEGYRMGSLNSALNRKAGDIS
jgi:uncharacterized protein